ncbi:MAG: hypothetical protein AAFV90_21830 [Cyanobacteria bacterium J06634_5]
MKIQLFDNKNYFVLAAIASVLTTGIAIKGSFTIRPGSDDLAIVNTPEQPSVLTSNPYDRIKIDMALVEVQALLVHPGTEVSSSKDTATYHWTDPDSSTIIKGVFENGLLIEKSRE